MAAWQLRGRDWVSGPVRVQIGGRRRDTGGVRDPCPVRHGEVHGRDRPKASHPIQAGSRWDVKRTHARMNGCGKPRCCTGRPRRDAARVRRPAFPAVARGRASRTPRRCSPGRGRRRSREAGLRSAHAGPTPAAMSIATADRTSPHPLTTTPQRPHMCRAIHLRARWLSCSAAARDGGGGMSREATCPC